MTMVNNPAVLSGLSARSVAIHLSHLFAQKRLIPSVHKSGSGNLNRFLKAISRADRHQDNPTTIASSESVRRGVPLCEYTRRERDCAPDGSSAAPQHLLTSDLIRSTRYTLSYGSHVHLCVIPILRSTLLMVFSLIGL